MKILYLYQHFMTRDGSAGTRAYEFAQLLQQRGHEVIIVCGWNDRAGIGHKPQSMTSFGNLMGVKLVQLNVPYSQKMSYVRRIWAFFQFMLLATWVSLRQSRVDVILASSTPLTISIPAMLVSYIKRWPFVFEVRDLWPEAPIALGILRNRFLITAARTLERLAYRRATQIVALSPGIKDGIMLAGVKPEKITIIPNACDNDLFNEPVAAGQEFCFKHPALVDRPLVVYAGSFGFVNGLEYLVRLAYRIQSYDSSIAFVLIGEGKEKERLFNLARDLGILDQTLWIMDAVPRREIPAVLKAATVAVSIFAPHPVTWANSANKFFDGLAAGRPIAINYEGWQADVLRESEAGLVLPATDIEQAAQQLLHFMHSPDRMERAREAAQRLAHEQFDRVALSFQLEQVLWKSTANHALGGPAASDGYAQSSASQQR